MSNMRLQVFLSHSGVCSRRKALELIKSGKIKVNYSVVTEPSRQIESSKDIVHLKDKRIFLKEKIYILLNKPKGVTTTKEDRFAKRTVMDLLPNKYKHLFPVGRLDKDTTGLLLLTNDGDLSYKLTHPSFIIDKVYTATLNKALVEDHRNRLQKGVRLDNKLTSPCKIIKLNERKVEITIHEGRKRQIKRMFALFDYGTVELKRESLGNLHIGNLAIGKWREISDRELLQLRKILQLNK